MKGKNMKLWKKNGICEDPNKQHEATMMQVGRLLSIPFMPSVLFSIEQARFILRRAWRRDVAVRSISRRKIKCTCYSCADARTVLTGCARPASLLRRILKLGYAHRVCKTSSSTQTSPLLAIGYFSLFRSFSHFARDILSPGARTESQEATILLFWISNRNRIKIDTNDESIVLFHLQNYYELDNTVISWLKNKEIVGNLFVINYGKYVERYRIF